MDLKAAVNKYLEMTASFGEPMPLDRFGLAKTQVEGMLSEWEEDYHLNRHFELVPALGTPSDRLDYCVNGVQYSAIVFRETIRDVLA